MCWFLRIILFNAVQQNSLIEQVKHKFTHYLQERGYRKTPERFAVLEEIYKQDKHFDIESLYQSMKPKQTHVSKATLYNTLEILLDCHLVRKTYFSDHVTYFEKSFQSSQHNHLICVKCNKIIDFCDPRLQQIKMDLQEQTQFKIISHAFNFYGICDSPNCQQ